MIDRATFLALADRCEQAAGPDRELDSDIALACGVVKSRDGDCFYGHKYYSVMVLNYDYDDTEYRAPELPSYTASLDAALTLVPEGWRYDLGKNTLGFAWGGVTMPDHNEVETSANTPALALCAAALRAMAAAHE